MAKQLFYRTCFSYDTSSGMELVVHWHVSNAQRLWFIVVRSHHCAKSLQPSRHTAQMGWVGPGQL